jgi:plastocyanin
MPSSFRSFQPLLAVAWATLPLACFSSFEDVTGLSEPVVEISATSQNRFQSANVTIRVGESVRWRNTGGAFHTVTFDPSRAADPANVELPDGVQPFNAPLDVGQSFSRRFTVPGVYQYICEPHEAIGMIATITVNP